MEELEGLITRLAAEDVMDGRAFGEPCDCNEPFSTCEYHLGFVAGALSLLSIFQIEIEETE